MPQTIGRGGTITLEGFYSDGTGQAVDAVTPKVSIIDPSNVTIVNMADPAHVGLGHYQYDYTVGAAADLGGWAARWYGLVNSVQVGPIDDPFTVVPAGSISFTQISGASCDDWCTAAEVTACGCGTTDPDAIDEAIPIASDVLAKLSGSRFTGRCTATVRPVNRPHGGFGLQREVRDAIIQGKLGWDYRGCTEHGFAACACGCFQQVRLGPGPIISIAEVLVDGVTLDAADYDVLDGDWLVRLDGGTFPACQDPRDPATEVGTFRVTYSYGHLPPPSGVKAAAKLACEIAKACASDATCELPERVQTIVRQGVTQLLLDPMVFLESGRTGIYLVDLFLIAYPRDEMTQGVSVQSPDFGPIAHRRRSENA